MTGTKTIAERLRCFDYAKTKCKGDIFAFALDEHINCPHSESCKECLNRLAIKLADAIEAEQAERQLPEGVIWPTYEDGELVKFGGKFVDFEGETHFVEKISFDEMGNFFIECGDWSGTWGKGEPVKRPEPEVLDADGVPIKVGDTVWHEDEGECVVERIYRQNGDTLLDLDVCGAVWNMDNVKPAEVTHRKPDTQEAINQDAALLVSESFFDQRRDEFEDRVFDLLKRQRKLLGGD